MQGKSELADVVQLTEMLRQKDKERAVLSERRRKAILKHRAGDAPVPYSELAKAMDISEARLYQIIKGKDGHVERRRAKKPEQPAT